MFKAVKGTRDILPPESALFAQLEEMARRVFSLYGLREIGLPLFEEAELFARSVGVETDIVNKEMYVFADRDGRSLALRPEATASVVRAYIEHQLHREAGLTKLFYMGPMFRRERPQKGRYRQFYQIGAEVLGNSDHPAIDAEVIEMLTLLLARVHIERWTLLVNSIGCGDCRPAFLKVLQAEISKVKAKLCADCQRRADTNPLRILDCKVPADQPLIEKLPSILDHLDKPCQEHFSSFRRQLEARGIPYTLKPRLVRGLDYYVRTTFEITSPVLGAQNALVGGGRYDGLAELLDGPPTKGFGFAIGEDRFVLAMQESGKVEAGRPIEIFVAWIGEASYLPALKLTRSLREAGFVVELPHDEAKLKKSLGLADKLGARYALILGEDEIAQQNVILRRMSDGEQVSVALDRVAEHIEQALRGKPVSAPRS